MELHQPDLLYGCINSVVSDADKEALSRKFVSRLGTSSHAIVVSELASFLLQEGSQETVECIEDHGTAGTSLESRLFTVTVGGKKRTYFFRVKDAAAACTLPLVGVLFALLTPKLSTAAVQAGTVVKNLWSNIIILHHDKDKDAIDVLTTISAIRASHFAGFPHDQIVGMEFPSTDEVASRIPGLSRDQVTAGIKRLESLHLIECKHWGDQAGDLAQKDNRWGERL